MRLQHYPLHHSAAHSIFIVCVHFKEQHKHSTIVPKEYLHTLIHKEIQAYNVQCKRQYCIHYLR